jgi:hypothetical protein
MRSVPPQAIEIGDLVVWIGNEDDIRWKLRLFRQEIFSMLIELGRRSGIHEQNLDVFGSEIGCVLNEIVYLFLAIGALVTGESTQDNQNH